MNVSDSTLLTSRYSTSAPPDLPQPTSADTAPSFSHSSDGLSTFLGFFVLMSSTVLLLFSMRNWKSSRETPTFSQEVKKWSDKLVFELPCRHCQYFQANRFLPCAVNPTQVLTAEAVNCSDFEAKQLHSPKHRSDSRSRDRASQH